MSSHHSSFALRVVAVLLSGVLLSCVTRQVPSSDEASRNTLILTAPGDRLVFQRGLHDTAWLPIAGRCDLPGGNVSARLHPVGSAKGAGNWQSLGTVDAEGHFTEGLRAKSGWYRLEVRVNGRGRETRATIGHVGVGEVFIVAGHSVAQGGDTNAAGALDDRVNTIAWPPDSSKARQEYERTADPQFLPPLVGTHFSDDVVPAPFGHGTYFWAQFAERVARTHDVPVLLLNAAFGGTSLSHWAKSARGETFEHTFVRSHLRMPYINVHHALRHYARVTGVRAILADQGQNDWKEKDGDKVFKHYVTWVEQARADCGFASLPIVVNRATPPGSSALIRQVQERVLREVPFCFPGPDYDTLAAAARYDGVHLGATGLDSAAQKWADALSPSFFKRAAPYQPSRSIAR